MGRSKKPLIYIALFAALLIVAGVLFTGGGDSGDVPLTGGAESLLERLRTQTAQIDQVEVDGSTVRLQYSDGSRFQSPIPFGIDFFEFLDREGINVSEPGFPRTDAKGGGAGLGALIGFLPLILFGGLLFYMLRRARGANGQAMSIGKSKARVITGKRPTVAFNDVAGAEEAKEELQEVVEFLRFPERFAALGAKIPGGVLLIGPPGTGKTLIAKAVAGEAAVPFFSISGSEFVEMFVGVGASRVRDLFEQARQNAPAIIFIDEIDAVGRQRGSGLGGGNDEREQTLNQILVEMDGFDSATNVIAIAATNRPDILDPALIRPGRFDRQVVLDAPDVKGREAILDVHKEGKPLAADVELGTIAKQTPGFSGADLANLLNEAAILAARRNKKQIGTPELEEAVDRVLVGPERKSRVLNGREQEIVAFHEAGHALVAAMIPGHAPVHKITIIPRGMAGGYTKYLPEEEQRLASRSHWEGFMASAMGGHAAEEVVFGEMTTGAHDDLSKASQIARSMVMQWGMSAKLGPRTFGKRESVVFLGREMGEQRDYSEKMAEQIDDEVRELIDRAHNRARSILVANRERLNYLAKRLAEEETLEPDQLREIFGWQPGTPGPETKRLEPPRSEPPASPPAPPTGGSDDRVRDPLLPPKPGLVWGGDRSNLHFPE